MVNKVSANVADFFLKNNIIHEKDTDLYIYGIHLIISSFLGISSILYCSIMIKKFMDSIIFLFCFITLRLYSGGYHADSYFKCNLFFISTFLITEMAVIFTHANCKDFLSVGMFCTSFMILLKYAPMDNKNKRLSKLQKSRNKKISLIIFASLVVVSTLLKITVHNYYYNIAVTVFSVTALMIIKILKEEKKKWKDLKK